MAQKRTLERFEDWKRVPGNMEVFFGKLEGDEKLTFRNACYGMRLPYMAMYRLVHEDPVLLARYDLILKARAHGMSEDSVEIADRVEPEKGSVAKAKLQVDTRQALASKWDRERYGERIQVERNVNVSVDAGLLGKAAELLQVAVTRERVVEGEVLTLPGPKVGDAEPR